MCLFCKIINNEIPSYKIYEDDDFLAFLDISQATVGHTLIVPKKHCANIFCLDDEIAQKIFVIVKKVSLILKEKLGISDINIINNSGSLAGQTIEHFHIHLIPRYSNDDFVVTQIDHSPSSLELSALCDKISK